MELPNFLAQYEGKTIVYCCNKGNAGDAIIHEAQIQLFEKAKINYTVMTYRDTVQGKTIFYSGAGNLNDMYPDCALFLRNNSKPELENTIVLLPHTIDGRVSLLSQLPASVSIICREETSLGHVSKHFPHTENILLSHDAAFYLDIEALLGRAYRPANSEQNKTLFCLRIDGERKDHHLSVENNNDISSTTYGQHHLYGPGRRLCAVDFIRAIEPFDRVVTNRLHVAIVASLMGRQVQLYSNSYHKNKSMYDFSFKHFGLDKNVTFVQ